MASGALRAGQRLPSVRAPGARGRPEPGDRGRRALRAAPARGGGDRAGRRTRIGEEPPVGSARALLPVPPGARDLSRGNPDPALLPDLERALSRLALPARLYGEPAALAELTALAGAQLSADGIPGEPLCVVSGALDGIERVLEAHLRPGDRVAVENPGYAALFDLLRARGLALEPVAVDERGMRPDRSSRPSRGGPARRSSRPAGRTRPARPWTRAGRASSARCWPALPHALVIEDDHLGAGRRRRAAHHRHRARALGGQPLGGQGARSRPAPGDACRATPRRSPACRAASRCGPGWVSHILQRLVLALWTDPATQQLVQRAGVTYAERRGGLLERLAERGVRAQRGLGPERVGAGGRGDGRGRRAAPARLGGGPGVALPAVGELAGDPRHDRHAARAGGRHDWPAISPTSSPRPAPPAADSPSCSRCRPPRG